ncbi:MULTISPECIES: Crp/Fnr family transcriptional regulator [Vibrio]|uniref:Cyclic nucleotide-binding domain-containing protein n=1 Tax=Vibrio splendidus TaxID=29497 RepID=A0A2N7JM45_VIBSP|nr:Crp/Fnr family transcriptional regulator [Vibrio splendidus]PMM42674.1 hypothetical protein BCT54_07970 [Vibrio splendidus]
MGEFSFSASMGGVPQKAMEELSFRAKNSLFQPGQYVHRCGDTAELLYYIQEGKIRINSVNEAGKELTVKDLLKGEWFGLIGCFGKQMRPNDAIALECTSLVVIRKNDFIDVANQHPEIWQWVTAVLARYVDSYYSRLMSNAFDTLLTRTESMLKQLSIWQGSNELQISQSELANLLGVTKEAVGIQLNYLKKQNKVSLSYKSVLLLKK